MGYGPYTEEKRYGFDYMAATNMPRDAFYGIYHINEEGPFEMGKNWLPCEETDLSIDYIRRHQAEHPDTPFMLMMSWIPPHWPYETLPDRYNIYDPEKIDLPANIPEQMAAFERRETALCLSETDGRIEKRCGKPSAPTGNYICFSFPSLCIVYYVIFHYMPMYGIVIAFKDYFPGQNLAATKWVGLQHFERFFGSYYFERVVTNTVTIRLFQIAVGFPAPTTLDEFADVLRAFRDLDANGNGDPTDEVLYSAHNWRNCMRGILPGFGLNFNFNFPVTYDETTNTMAFAATTDAFKAALEYMKMLYSEGLLDQEIFSQTNTRFHGMLPNDEFGVVLLPQTLNAGPAAPDLMGLEPFIGPAGADKRVWSYNSSYVYNTALPSSLPTAKTPNWR